jgi:hypothetical protein
MGVRVPTQVINSLVPALRLCRGLGQCLLRPGPAAGWQLASWSGQLACAPSSPYSSTWLIQCCESFVVVQYLELEQRVEVLNARFAVSWMLRLICGRLGSCVIVITIRKQGAWNL